MDGSSPIRVAYLIEKFPPLFGGHGIQIDRTLPFLRSRGIAPSIITYRLHAPTPVPPDDRSGAVQRCLDPGDSRRATFARLVQLRRHMRAHGHRYDLIHSVISCWEFLLNIRYFRKLGLPMVFEMILLDGDDPLTLSRERFGSVKLGLMRQMDAWIGIAGAFLPRLRAVGLPEERFHLIRCGVDVDAFRPAPRSMQQDLRRRLGIPPDGRVVISAGSIIPRKGMDRVVAAWSRFLPRPGRDLLLLVGPASAEEGLQRSDLAHLDEVRRAASAPGVAGTVRFQGRVDNLQDYFGAADIFLFLSRQEGLGNVILEAQSCGLPVIVSHLDGIAAEIVDEGETGLIMRNADDPAEAAAALSKLFADKALREAIGHAGRQAALARFSFDSRATALVDLYRTILASSRARS